jgi:hypothetical protein
MKKSWKPGGWWRLRNWISEPLPWASIFWTAGRKMLGKPGRPSMIKYVIKPEIWLRWERESSGILAFLLLTSVFRLHP